MKLIIREKNMSDTILNIDPNARLAQFSDSILDENTNLYRNVFLGAFLIFILHYICIVAAPIFMDSFIIVSGLMVFYIAFYLLKFLVLQISCSDS